MAKIKCPKCGEIIKLDKSSYDALLSEIEKEEIESRINAQIKAIEAKYKAEYALEVNKQKSINDSKVAELIKTNALLEEKLKGAEKDTKIAIAKALDQSKNELNKKEQEIIKLKGDVTLIQKEGESAIQKLKENYEFSIKAKNDEIEKYKNFRLGDSTKDLGESLEKYCHDAFDQIRAVAYPHAYFEKDNTVDAEGKGDFIFKDFADDNTEIVSIMFEMKNQKDTTKTKHKNEQFFEKLDKNRTSKKCEYAVLVTTLEEDSKLYNSGIVDVSYRYPKMFVVRPQNFLTIIGLIRNMALNNVAYKQQLVAYQKENIDITNFEEAVKQVADKINADYEKAGAIYGDVDKMCDGIIDKVENFRKQFKTAAGWIEKAKNQLPNLEVRKLTRGNKTMKEKFNSLKEDEQ